MGWAQVVRGIYSKIRNSVGGTNWSPLQRKKEKEGEGNNGGSHEGKSAREESGESMQRVMGSVPRLKV